MGEDFVDIQGDIEAGRLITASQAPVPKYIAYGLMHRGVAHEGQRVKLRSVKVGSAVFFYKSELERLLSYKRKYGRRNG